MNSKSDSTHELKEEEFAKLIEKINRAKRNAIKYKDSTADLGFENQHYYLVQEAGNYIHWFEENGTLEIIEKKYPDLQTAFTLRDRDESKKTKKNEFEELFLRFYNDDNADPAMVKRELWDKKRWINCSKLLTDVCDKHGIQRSELKDKPAFRLLPIQ